MAHTKVDCNPFLDPAAPSLATVLEALETAEPNLRRRGEMASGVRTVCGVLGHRPHELPADTALLGRLIRKAIPAAAGVSRSRWANARSLLLGALKLSGLAIMPGRRLHPLAPSWAALAAALPGRYERAMLSRLMRWASAEGIDPGHLDQAAVDRFGTALMQDSFHENPRDCWRRTVVAWNTAVARMPSWPQQQFSPPPGPERYVVALEAFPASFQADAQTWLDRLAGKVALDAGPVRPVRPATIDKWHFALRQLGSALVAAGRDIASITQLEDLVTLEAADTILRFYLERAGNRPCAQTAAIANHLKAIARHHVDVPSPILDRLRRMAARVTPPVQGMTDKNRGALRQFQDIEAQRKLVQLPAGLFAALPASGPVGERLAVCVQLALAVEILLVAPMRLRNLCRLELGRHLHDLGHGRRSRWLITIPGNEVKNGEPIELPLPERSVRLLEIYRARILPLFGQTGSLFLFPGRNGAKAEVTLGSQITRLLQRELGVRLSPHQFRHLVGYIYLLRHPNGHEVIRRMLGHRDIRTTIKFYAGMEMAEAARHYEAVLEELTEPKLCTGSGRTRRSRRPDSKSGSAQGRRSGW
jgi:integrase